MEFSVTQKDFASAVALVAPYARGLGNGIMDNVKIEAEEPGAVVVSAVSQAASASISIPAVVTRAGAALVDSRRLVAITGQLDSDVVPIEVDAVGSRVTIAISGTSYRLNSPDVEDFPEPARVEGGHPVIVPAAAPLAAAMGKALKATPKKDHRMVLVGVLLELSDSGAVLTATDGKRLYRSATIPCECDRGAPPASAIIPREIAAQIASTPLASLTQDGRRLGLVFANGLRVIAQLVAGKYPDCSVVIPQDRRPRAEILVAHAEGCIRRAGIIAADGKNSPVIFRFDGNRCDVSACTAGAGKFDGGFPVTPSDGASPAPFETAFNSRFFSDLMGALASDGIKSVGYVHSDANKPAIFDAGTGEVFLLMPVKLIEARAAMMETDGAQEVAE
jgi:DNA polymerase III sliding clamp (beta) subunit (PCNA family)